MITTNAAIEIEGFTPECTYINDSGNTCAEYFIFDERGIVAEAIQLCDLKNKVDEIVDKLNIAAAVTSRYEDGFIVTVEWK